MFGRAHNAGATNFCPYTALPETVLVYLYPQRQTFVTGLLIMRIQANPAIIEAHKSYPVIVYASTYDWSF